MCIPNAIMSLPGWSINTWPSIGMPICRSRLTLNINNTPLRVFQESVFAVRAANAGVLPSRVKGLDGLRVLAIDIGFTELEFVAGAHVHVQALCVNGGGEPVFGVVRQSQCFIQIVERNDRQDRPEHFFAYHAHVLGAVAQHRRLEVEASEVWAVPTSCKEFGTIVNGVLHETSYGLPPRTIDERTVIHRLVKWIAEAHLLHGFRQPSAELVEPLAVDIHTLGAIADLSGIMNARIAAAIMRMPVATLPVMVISRTPEWRHKASPTSRPPGRIFTTPLGRPICCTSLPTSQAFTGVSSDGLIT